ncbi:diadenylate cyclase CdaA [Priestia flexa]|jgi:diadenylate cyclase|uniref:Diadenylate cyclase n=1 Tax=Priestia flexa TaxID=86664 RepID=A0A8I1SQL2_9BACI|nr:MULTISPECIES: diadenylate cyclase CdaA [Bacillaceae]MBY6024534.1 diadenylate cyclase CdaA [Nitratireductor sp. DP7N14-4]OZT10830.1 TIGR00159 family protein [Priestia aryabhattai]USY55316.1 diadenylate cyclase CdaA [Bacillus sp. 1780r2a1]MBN8253848.1 TIGR00159 family protein [Priestia flexa]MBN8436275.1 TIGR00159 family protein [Priestia flexa]
MPFGELPIFAYLGNIIDVLLVWFVIYKLIMVIRGTKAVQLLKGIIVIVVVRFISNFLGLNTLQWLMDQALTWGFLAVIIIFQPEVRRALEQLGRGSLFSKASLPEEDERALTIEAITKATHYMAKRRIGALISIERETGMNDYIETGIPLNANVSSELLINLFIPNTPLHDGAVILQRNQVSAAACYLPLSESPFISKELGTRHRAAVGISEVTDSITVIVSEETGGISVTKNGELYRELTIDTLKEMLEKELVNTSRASSSARWQWRSKKNG